MESMYGDLEALTKLICPEEDEDEPKSYKQFTAGSVLNPGSFGQEKKSQAKPHAKIEVKKPGAQPVPEEPEDDPNDTRPEPEYDIVYKQRVGAEDIFLGMSGLDPSSVCCQEILIKVKLPDTKYKDVTLDVDSRWLRLKTPLYKLNLGLPHPVRDKEGRAQWLTEREELHVSLPLNKEEVPL
mmetsp:Transcript_33515/g.58709  ORF Transcript_33515/g.58709 Transcript_33515/m.58709 type:complete len:182 (+) Transcript_33515:2219-2764(+)